MSILGDSYMAKSPTHMAAYNRLQAALMRRFLRRGGTLERWLECIAPVFRTRYGWLCQQPAVARTRERAICHTPSRRHTSL